MHVARERWGEWDALAHCQRRLETLDTIAKGERARSPDQAGPARAEPDPPPPPTPQRGLVASMLRLMGKRRPPQPMDPDARVVEVVMGAVGGVPVADVREAGLGQLGPQVGGIEHGVMVVVGPVLAAHQGAVDGADGIPALGVDAHDVVEVRDRQPQGPAGTQDAPKLRQGRHHLAAPHVLQHVGQVDEVQRRLGDHREVVQVRMDDVDMGQRHRIQVDEPGGIDLAAADVEHLLAARPLRPARRARGPLARGPRLASALAMVPPTVPQPAGDASSAPFSHGRCPVGRRRRNSTRPPGVWRTHGACAR